MIPYFSERFRQLRINKHLRQDQVAALIGVHKGSISAYETSAREPSIEMLIKIANLFSVSTDYLLGRAETRTVDISGLTEKEAANICELIADLSQKNTALNKIDVSMVKK